MIEMIVVLKFRSVFILVVFCIGFVLKVIEVIKSEMVKLIVVIKLIMIRLMICMFLGIFSCMGEVVI